MGFYYLKQTKETPLNENDFKYLIYIENYDNKPVLLPIDTGIPYYAFELLDKPLWNVEDEVIDVVGTEGVVMSRFKKVHDQVGFTIWKNEGF